MQWDDGQQSENVEDVRGSGGGSFGGFGGRTIGIGTVVVALVASYFFGVDPSVILGLAGGGGGTQVQQPTAPAREVPANDKPARFVSRVLLDTEQTWTEIFAKNGAQYRKPKLDIFSGAYPTACGQGVAASGPFYCPADEKIYIDLEFYRLLEQRFHAPGDFAQAYVIAHEVGHHVQKQLGITAKTDAMRRRMSEPEYNRVSVRIELQADCFAGVWGHRLAAGESAIKLDPGDVDEALRAATAIGDDTLQKQARGTVVPDSFTHGTSAQRVSWFKRGMDSGDFRQCDTFSAGGL
ncbi:MAG: KPN_02809 family neutral zinc metallopeptidase [Burkholderiaceae bacterium]